MGKLKIRLLPTITIYFQNSSVPTNETPGLSFQKHQQLRIHHPHQAEPPVRVTATDIQSRRKGTRSLPRPRIRIIREVDEPVWIHGGFQSNFFCFFFLFVTTRILQCGHSQITSAVLLCAAAYNRNYQAVLDGGLLERIVGSEFFSVATKSIR